MSVTLPAGAVIICENGHYICKTSHKMVANDSRPVVRSKWFVEFGSEHYVPKTGDGASACTCGICGAPWIVERPGAYSDEKPALVAKIRVQGYGWWPPAPPGYVYDPETGTAQAAPTAIRK
jgi:hypothetical protein